MREEGYTEAGGGDGLDLQVAPYYANSLRTFLGMDVKTSFDLLARHSLQPEARLGYRYDFVAVPVKLKAGFCLDRRPQPPATPSPLIGPDPDTGNAVAGFGLGSGTGTWNIGINYDWIRGNNAVHDAGRHPHRFGPYLERSTSSAVRASRPRAPVAASLRPAAAARSRCRRANG